MLHIQSLYPGEFMHWLSSLKSHTCLTQVSGMVQDQVTYVLPYSRNKQARWWLANLHVQGGDEQ